MDSTELIKSLMSEVCPACDKAKQKRKTFCNKCYFKLPKDQRTALYNRVGDGYEEAFADALKTLKPA